LKNKKDEKKFYTSKNWKKIIFMKFAPKRSAPKWAMSKRATTKWAAPKSGASV